MAFSIVSWNVEENQDWYVRISDNGTGIDVELYESLADATAQIDMVDSATGTYGNSYIILSSLDVFQETFAWHMVTSGNSGDPAVILKVSKFVELSPITDAAFKNNDIVIARGTSEIRASTNAVITNRLELAQFDDNNVGDIVKIDSARISSELTQLQDLIIEADATSLLVTVELNEYKEMVRN